MILAFIHAHYVTIGVRNVPAAVYGAPVPLGSWCRASPSMGFRRVRNNIQATSHLGSKATAVVFPDTYWRLQGNEIAAGKPPTLNMCEAHNPPEKVYEQ